MVISRVLEHRGPKDCINIRISNSDSKAQCKGDTRNHGLQDPCVYVIFGRPKPE